MVKVHIENFVINGLTFFLFKKDTNDHKSYEYEVSLIDIYNIYIYKLVSFKLNYILYKNIKYVSFKICIEKLLRS